MDNKQQKRKAYMQRYREKNCKKIKTSNRSYYEKNREAILEERQENYIENRNIVLENRRETYIENRDVILENRRETYIVNRDVILENRRETYMENRDVILEKRNENREIVSARNHEYYSENRNDMSGERRRSYGENRRVIKERTNSRRQKASEKHFKSGVFGSPNFVYPITHCLGSLNVECEHCEALHFKDELKSMCCHNGKLSHLSVENVSENFPIALKNLFTGTDEKCTNFREFIRQYNNANAFASMGAKIEEIPGNGPYCFKISGEVYHRTSENIQIDNTLNQNTVHRLSHQPSYAELYVYDSDTSINVRMANPANVQCLRDNMITINTVLNDVSPYASCYRKLREVYEKEMSNARNAGSSTKKISLIFTRNLHDDQRVYNAPRTSDDVAIVYVADRDGNIPAELDFAVQSSDSNSLKRINMLSKHLDPMLFPLFFPKGDFGWTTNLFHNLGHATNIRNRVTVLQFYSNKIAIRRNYFNPLFYGGKLFQQYLVYASARYEANRMTYIRNNQKTLRVESYKGLLDHVNNIGRDNNARIGNIFILPSTYVGGPRFMSKLYQDNMAMVRKFGRPDLFITFTCNPKWDEIKSELQSFQTSSDRPDLVTRVFRLKLKEFLDDIIKRKILGDILAYVYVIEHQKRGLPHAHCLFTLSNEDKIKAADDVDSIISAELPNRNEQPELYNVILTQNIHGPCGRLNPKSICMVEGSCSKNFPKAFCTETDVSTDGYPSYRRRNNSNEAHFTRGKIQVDNRFVVPYNSFLSLKYNAHINVELCSTVKAIKYINKYITKGHDCARIGVHVNPNDNTERVVDYDEIKQYLNCRYISSQEAAWHLQDFPIHGQSHNVVMLSIHLKNGQSIFFKEDQVENALRRESVTCTTLTAYFDLNVSDQSAHQYLYQDIPNHYIIKDKKWVKRSASSHYKEKAIGRIISVSPKDVELYHLRLILLSVKGVEATSFENLKKFNDQTYSTYKEVARVRGLINDSNEWHNCMSEASSYMMPKSLRSLLVTIICHCNPGNPLQLFEDFKENMIEDFIHQGNSVEKSVKLCIKDIRAQMERDGFDFNQFLPFPNFEDISDCEDSSANSIIVNNNLLWDDLNSDQLLAAEAVLKSVLDLNPQKCFYIDGPGGSGKTFLYRALIQEVNIIGKKTLIVAWTGIAATLLPGGITCHSAFSLPLDLSSVKFPRLTQTKKEFLKSIDLLMWDEAPMAPGTALEIVDLIFQDLMSIKIPFGGKVVVLGGDFRQVLPVIKKGSRCAIIASTIKKCSVWPLFLTFKLTRNMRAITDPDFSKWLLDIGDGIIPSPSTAKTQFSVEIPISFISNDITSDIFGNSFTCADVENFSKRSILCPRNEDVRLINERVLISLKNVEQMSFYAIDSVKNDDGVEDHDLQVNIPVEFLNTLNPSGLPPHKLNLKIGCIVMLLRNLSVNKGLCNGTRMTVRAFRQNVLQLEIITGAFAGTIHFIPRISLDTLNDPALPFNFVRHQFPVRLAYAMTINKSQGQTFNKVGLYLPEPVFSHGQFYTGCSRATESNCLKIQVQDTTRQGKTNSGRTVTDNVVYKEIFS